MPLKINSNQMFSVVTLKHTIHCRPRIIRRLLLRNHFLKAKYDP